MELDEAKAEQFDGGRCNALFWQLTPTVITTRVSGHVERTALTFYTQRVDRILARGACVSVFHDWRGITTFDSDVREPYRDWAVGKEGLIEPTFLVKSRVLAMALSVSALVIKRELAVLASHAEFARRLELAAQRSQSSVPPARR